MNFLPKQIQKHPFEYLILALIFTTTAFFYLYFSFNGRIQRRVVYATAAAYFFWSLYHHHRRGDLELSIIIEYLAFALLGTLLLTGTLL